MDAKRISYDRWPGFEHVYLEDSFVLGIASDMTHNRIELELALLEGHPAYSRPRAGGRHCYKPGVLRWDAAHAVSWLRLAMRPIHDASGVADFGNIDHVYEQGGAYRVGGEWGEVRVVAARAPSIELTFRPK